MGSARHRWSTRSRVAAAAAGCVFAGSAAVHAGTSGTRTNAEPQRVAGLSAQSAAASPINAAGAVQAAWYGASLGTWTARQWQWLLSIPLGVSPETDSAGLNCAINQDGPVWYLSAPSGSTSDRYCTIPSDKAILSPIVTYLNDYPCPEPPPFEPAPGQTLQDFLAQGAAGLIDTATLSEADLDGRSLKVRRVTASLFGFTAARDLVALDGCLAGSPQLGVSDGYFVFIEPLSPGQHTLRIQANSIFGATDNTFHLTITTAPRRE
jgi:hypothetical protein